MLFLLLIVWVRVEARAPAAMIGVRLLTHRPVPLTNLITLLNGFVIFGIFVLVPHLTEAPRGLGAEASRLVDYGFGSSRAGFNLVPAAFIQFVARRRRRRRPGRLRPGRRFLSPRGRIDGYGRQADPEQHRPFPRSTPDR